MKNGTGTDIKISKSQLRNVVKHDGSLFSLLMKLVSVALPLAKKAVGPVLSGPLSGLASLGVDKIFGKGQTGGFLMPNNKTVQLIQYKHLLTSAQKKTILDSLQSGGQLVFKPSKTQQGGFLGTLFASIGIPMLLNAIAGKGHGHSLQVDRSRSRSKKSLPVYVPPKYGGLIYTLPFYGSWNDNKMVGMGTKERQWTVNKHVRITTKQELKFSPLNKPINIRFINKPLSNYDLLNWIDKFKIKHFIGVSSVFRCKLIMWNY